MVQGLISGAKVANSKEGGVYVPDLCCFLFLSDLEGILLHCVFFSIVKIEIITFLPGWQG